MLTVANLSLSFGVQPILQSVSFSLSPGERLGLVGPNGGGKSTLLRLLVGELSPHAGRIHRDPALRLGYLPQGFDLDAAAGTRSVAAYLDRLAGDLAGLSARLERLARDLAAAPDRSDLQADFDATLRALTLADQRAGEAPAVLAALGLGAVPPEQPVATLSGGQKTRLALAGLLVSAPDVLLLDEPTNHLDLAMLAWLEDWLRRAPQAVLLVSHDRRFLDATATAILELDPASHTVRQFPGGYSDYLAAKSRELDQQSQAYRDQQDEIARLRAAAAQERGEARFRRGGKADSGDKFLKGYLANRSKATVGRAKHLERRIERLLTADKIDKPRPAWQMALEFTPTRHLGQDTLILEDVSLGYDPTSPLVTGISLRVRAAARVAILGPNGSGKTTLLRTLNGDLPPLAGTIRRGPSVRLGYLAQEAPLPPTGTDALSTLRAQFPASETEARRTLHRFLFSGDQVFTPLARLSYGERARLQLALLAAAGCNLLLLDEPLNHLDIPSRTQFEAALAEFPGAVLAVVHDRYFVERFAAEVWTFADGGLNLWERP
jgi:ATP-binding cassette subfamily F protein 3